MHVSPSTVRPSMEPVPATALAPRPAAVAADDGPFGVAALRARLGVSAAPLTRWHWILPLLVTAIIAAETAPEDEPTTGPAGASEPDGA